jgi:hypothetical protein
VGVGPGGDLAWRGAPSKLVGMRRSLLAPVVVLVGLGASACGSSSTPGPSSTTGGTGHRAGLVVITESTKTESVAKVGDVVEVELTSASYGRDGRLVPWSRPTAGAPALLVPTGSPRGVNCPPDATCTFFVARGVGAVTVSAVGPSGILCTATGTRCIAVSAVVRRFTVRIETA